MPSNKDKNKSHELDETLKRLGQHSGVMGTIVVNSEGETHWIHFYKGYGRMEKLCTKYMLIELNIRSNRNIMIIGIAVKTTLDGSQTVQYTALISGITKQVS